MWRCILKSIFLQYTVLEIRQKSYHPADNYLWMVSAKKEDGTYAVWTAWNESSQSLNFGHYNLKSIEDCEKVFEEFYYKGQEQGNFGFRAGVPACFS